MLIIKIVPWYHPFFIALVRRSAAIRGLGQNNYWCIVHHWLIMSHRPIDLTKVLIFIVPFSRTWWNFTICGRRLQGPTTTDHTVGEDRALCGGFETPATLRALEPPRKNHLVQYPLRHLVCFFTFVCFIVSFFILSLTPLANYNPSVGCFNLVRRGLNRERFVF